MNELDICIITQRHANPYTFIMSCYILLITIHAKICPIHMYGACQVNHGVDGYGSLSSIRRVKIMEDFELLRSLKIQSTQVSLRENKPSSLFSLARQLSQLEKNQTQGLKNHVKTQYILHLMKREAYFPFLVHVEER